MSKKGSIPWNKGLKGYMAGKKTQFKKGHIPWNKDTKGLSKVNGGCFKKGCTPATKMPIGMIVYKKHHREKYYRKHIKIGEPGTWQVYARYVWETHHKKKIPPGHVIHHIDFDILNDDIDNLRLITKGECLDLHREFQDRSGFFEKMRWNRIKRDWLVDHLI